MPKGSLGPPAWGLPRADLEDSVSASASDLATLADSRILVTGGTGFLGGWLTASLLAADAMLGLGLRIVLLTRSRGSVPLDDASNLTIIEGDVRQLPPIGDVDAIIHGAASSSASWGTEEADPLRMADTIIRGTQAVLDTAVSRSARVLFLSSGAVYGPQAAPVDEDAGTAPDPTDPRSAYGNAKRLAENLCAAATADGAAQAVIGRLFAFVGPRIPVNVHFAAGNFLLDAVEGDEIQIRGDGRDVRSYLYAGDLPEWCWSLLARGQPGRAYNVGSPEPVTVKGLAERIAMVSERNPVVRVLGLPAVSPSYYVPRTDRALAELGLRPRTSLNTALQKTYEWLLSQRSP